MFLVALIKARPSLQFIKDNCTHIKNRYHFYEGDIDYIKEVVPDVEILGEGVVPSLGGLNKDELSEIAKNNIGVDITQETLCKNGEHDWRSGPWVEVEDGCGTATCVCGADAISESMREDF